MKTVRIPHIGISQQAPLISVDWLSLCQAFYVDELRLRRAHKPNGNTAIDMGSWSKDKWISHYDKYCEENQYNRYYFWTPVSTGSSSRV